ncbi:protein of unknown function [Burkholderia multivorans]
MLEPLCSVAWLGHFCADHIAGYGTGCQALSKRLSFGYFSLARQRKVTAAPRRGDPNRPIKKRDPAKKKKLPERKSAQGPLSPSRLSR